MDPILLAFITGLTTGGLSCLAVQGGLLATSLAQQIEQDISQAPVQKGKNRPHARVRHNTALPILLFLVAKLLAYTLLGFLLGAVGSFLTFDPITRALMLIAIGVFMIGNALRMFNVHPIFRYFNLEPPKFITRYIRRTAKNGTELFTPLFLGALTVFIPCGVTQAMMAAAMATGSPATGAALMFSFTVGTSVVFFLVAYLATSLGARLEKWFMRFVAVVVLILGLVSVNNGLNLLDSPFSLNHLTAGLFPAAQSAVTEATAAPAQGSGKAALELAVKNNGYYPQVLRAPANQPVTLDLVTNKTFSCARDFVIPDLKYYQLLPETGRVSVSIAPQQAGTTIGFTCSMGMYTGEIVFENSGGQQ
jgi:sulfite exporter TauE/SafE